MIYFKEMALNRELQSALETINFVNPTPIQEKTIPFILENSQDLIALAQTGTGKTAAFGLPLLNMLDTTSKAVQAFILCPTRELCLQITRDLMSFASQMSGVNIVAVYGGASISNQLRDLRKGANIVVGTPGRVNDFVKRGNLNVSNVKWLVLDEADEMLNMGFKEELDSILANTPNDKQTLLFSATMPREIQQISKNYMHEPLEISVGSKNSGTETVFHHVYTVRARDKYLALKRVADMNPNIYGIVFCRTKKETQEIAEKLQFDGYNADSLHGDLSQGVRESVMSKFRNMHIQMLVATDVAARGIDIDDLTHVINYGLPDEDDVYIHRSGRTGRAGKTGICITIAHSKDGRKLKFIERRLGQPLEFKELPSGKEICQRQLFNLIDNVEKVEVNDEQIDPFMDVIFKKLAWLEREDLIKHFVAVEFNKFLEYYKNAGDINYHRDHDDFDSQLGRGKDSRGSRSRDRDRSGDRDRGGERGGRGRTRRAEPGFTRFFMNIGGAQDLTPPKLIGILNDLKVASRLNIGKIDIKDGFSFFEVESTYEDALMQKFTKGVKYGKSNVRIEIAK
ncbi:DEAD/DEAH box helicase [bacterium]|nr:DEAD/DEAH box helicase [bacterium]